MSGRSVFSSPSEALCWAAEVQLATLEGARSVKRTPKCELRRHEDIADSLVFACKMFASVEIASKARCFRVADHIGGTAAPIRSTDHDTKGQEK